MNSLPANPVKWLLAVILMLTASGLHAQKTTSRGLKMRSRPVVELRDTVTGALADSIVAFSGYEKTLSATRETLFITNRGEAPVEALSFDIAYHDRAGRLLHSRRVDLNCYIPAGETRRVDFRSWDTQKSFYFSGGPRPRVSAIPYTVAITHPRVIFSTESK